MIMLIHVEDRKVILKEDLATKVEIIERDLTKDLGGLEVVATTKLHLFPR